MTTQTEVQSSAKFITPQLLAVSIFLGLGSLFFNVLPVFLDAAADKLTLTERQIGFLGSAFLAGQMVFNISGLYWLGRISWRKVLIASIFILAASMTATVYANLMALNILYFVIGCASGSILACVFCAMGTSGDPKRMYGVGLMIQMCMAGLIVYLATSVLIPNVGFLGFNIFTASFCLLALLAVPFFPAAAPDNAVEVIPEDVIAEPTEKKSPGSKFMLLPMIGLLGVLVYFIGQTGFWAFLMRIGGANGISDADAGSVIAIVLVLSGFAALVPTLIGNRIGIVIPLLIGVTAFVGAMFIMSVGTTIAMFAIGVMIQSSAWNFTVPYQIEAISRVDNTGGRFASQMPAAQAIGGTIGPAMGGMLVFGNSFLWMYVMAATTAIISMLLFVFVFKSGDRKSTSTGVVSV